MKGVGNKPRGRKRSTTKERDTDRAVGLRLHTLRIASDMTAEQLGRQLGLSMQQIMKYEHGENRISASLLFRIAGLFGVPVGSFFDGVVSLSHPEAAVVERDLLAFLASPEGRELAAVFQRIGSADQRRRIVALAQALAEVSAHGQGRR